MFPCSIKVLEYLLVVPFVIVPLRFVLMGCFPIDVTVAEVSRFRSTGVICVFKELVMVGTCSKSSCVFFWLEGLLVMGLSSLILSCF